MNVNILIVQKDIIERGLDISSPPFFQYVKDNAFIKEKHEDIFFFTWNLRNRVTGCVVSMYHSNSINLIDGFVGAREQPDGLVRERTQVR